MTIDYEVLQEKVSIIHGLILDYDEQQEICILRDERNDVVVSIKEAEFDKRYLEMDDVYEAAKDLHQLYCFHRDEV